MDHSNQLIDSQQQLTQKTKRRRRLLKKIIRNNRQVVSDKQFEILLNFDKEMFAGYNAHRLGNFCIQQNRFELAQQNLLRAKQLIQKKFLFTNVYFSLGNLELKRKNGAKACQYYEKVVELSPHRNSKIYFNKDQVIFAGKLNSFSAYSEAHDQLIKIYVQSNELQKGYQICKAALDLKQQQQSAIINFADTMERLLGNRNDAFTYAWKKLVEQTKTKQQISQLQGFQPIIIKPWANNQENYKGLKQISIFSVKWGVKYSSQHVNKLFAGIKRNTSWNVNFYCFTDDSYGIDKSITIKPLDDEWKRQWGKSVLFSTDIEGKKAYIDLDTVITGNLDQLFEYQGEFTTLKTVQQQGQIFTHRGYTTFVMIWQGKIFRYIYEKLEKKYDTIEKLLVKFDFWLDLMISNADDLSTIYPGKIISFKPGAQTSAPEGCSIVHFPKRLKPQSYPAQWVKKYWIT